MISGRETPIEGRIIQVADAFSAMIIKRVYRKVFSVDEALEELIRNKGKQFDPEIVDRFVNIIRNNKTS